MTRPATGAEMADDKRPRAVHAGQRNSTTLRPSNSPSTMNGARATRSGGHWPLDPQRLHPHAASPAAARRSASARHLLMLIMLSVSRSILSDLCRSSCRTALYRAVLRGRGSAAGQRGPWRVRWARSTRSGHRDGNKVDVAHRGGHVDGDQTRRRSRSRRCSVRSASV